MWALVVAALAAPAHSAQGASLSDRLRDLTGPSGPVLPGYTEGGPFDQDTVMALARNLSRLPYQPPRSTLPDSLAKLQYDQYREIRFRRSATIWAKRGQRFGLQPLPLGYLFTTPVEIALVEGGVARHLAYRPELFETGDLVKDPLPKEDVGFSGFRVLYPLNSPRRLDELAVFQGASYFRSLGRGQVYGLSARGLALKVGDPSGEEFPLFRAFWIEAPQPGSQVLVIHALLDSPSVVGAYRFELHPGREDDQMRVEAVLFPRVDLAEVGLAPGTSMFMFAPDDPVGVDDFRPQVHDSDGLLVINGQGEHLWRPLSNPARLQLNAFEDQGTQAFGLIQRDRDPGDYQDFESHFERRPTLWVEPEGDWGPGAVVLVEIPSDSEIHDNVVAFWRPKAPIPAGAAYRLVYRLSWGGEPAAAKDRLRVLRTGVGRADVKVPTPVRRFVVDYSANPAGCKGRCAPPRAAVANSAGKVRDVVVAENPLTHGYRVTFLLDPEGAELAELRVDLSFDDGRRAEVWSFRWTKP